MEDKGYGEWDDHSRQNFIFLIFSIGFIFLGFLAYSAFAPLRLEGGRIRVEISTGTGLWTIAELLQKQGLIRSRWAFGLLAAISGNADKLKAGTYEFRGRVTSREVVKQLVAGQVHPNELVITIPEGWDLRDLAGYFERMGLFPAETWWTAAGRPAMDYRQIRASAKPPDFSKEFDFLADKPSFLGLEGYLYPDTYRVFRGASAPEVTRKMLENFGRKLTPELRAEITRQKKTIFEIVTLAAMIEKEVPESNDRRIVAGILWKRYASGIPLQVDATISYITGRRETPSAEDLDIDSPYNTYRYPGLSLGPIANPGMETIRSAIFPQPSPYLYYLSNRDGQTIFSRTLEEHNAAKAVHLR
ncbi:MAG: endolytic transglycosylase MltG [Patescibacteria group bacterium]